MQINNKWYSIPSGELSERKVQKDIDHEKYLEYDELRDAHLASKGAPSERQRKGGQYVF